MTEQGGKRTEHVTRAEPIENQSRRRSLCQRRQPSAAINRPWAAPGASTALPSAAILYTRPLLALRAGATRLHQTKCGVEAVAGKIFGAVPDDSASNIRRRAAIMINNEGRKGDRSFRHDGDQCLYENQVRRKNETAAKAAHLSGGVASAFGPGRAIHNQRHRQSPASHRAADSLPALLTRRRPGRRREIRERP